MWWTDFTPRRRDWFLLGGSLVLIALIAVGWWGRPTLKTIENRQSLDELENNTNISEFINEDIPEPTPPPVPFLLATTGDVMLGRSVNTTGYRRGDWGWWSREVDKHLAPYDLVMANLETPIITNCPLRDDGMLFCADPGAATALAASNIGMVTLANNHIYNQGQGGYHETMALLDAAGVPYVDDKRLWILSHDGYRYGFIAYDDVSVPIELDAWRELISSAAGQVDLLVVAVHWGNEYQYAPTARMEMLGHAAIDAGAVLVIGNHSHWLGTVEKYGDGAIIYSHGNFVFDQEWASETKRGLFAVWRIEGDQVTSVWIYPIHITNYGLAHWAAGTPVGDEILTTFLRESGNGTLVGDHVEIDLQATPRLTGDSGGYEATNAGLTFGSNQVQ